MTFLKRVRRGAELLDKELPGWYKKVRKARLQMADGCDCLLGQLYGDVDDEGYDNGVEELGLTEKQSQAHGFNLQWGGGEDSYDNFDILGGDWWQVIREHREA